MKKIIALLLTLVLVCGCSNANSYSSLSDENEVLFTGPNNYAYTKGQLYKTLKLSSSDTMAPVLLSDIAKHYESIDFDEMAKMADEDIEFYKSVGYEQYIISNYGSLDAYKDTYIASMTQMELAKIYVEENLETLVSENSPVKMQIASFASEEDAQNCINDANNGSTFDMAAVNNNSVNTPESAVYLDTDTSLAYEVKEYVNSVNGMGISTIIPSTTSTNNADGTTTETTTYYVVNIESRIESEFHDEFVETMAASVESSLVTDYFFNKHKIEFFDQDIYELMSSKYEVLK